jgi:hypothetical protein
MLAADRFEAAPAFDTGLVGPDGIAVGDFNNDGNPDLAIASVMNQSISVLLGNGKGGFGKPINVGYAVTTGMLAVADVNGDGNLDIISSYDRATYVFLGKGDGTFQPGTSYPSDLFSGAVLTGDFNGDHAIDIAIVGFNGGGAGMDVFLNRGDGTFNSEITYPINYASLYAVIGDFNHDGNLDVATSSASAGVISVLLGKGNGTFQNPLTYAAGASPASLAAADVNHDGNLDLVVANSSAVSVLLGKGDGTFGAPIGSSGPGNGILTVGNFNDDDRPDIAITLPPNPSGNSSATSVTLLLGNGDGTFLATNRYYNAPDAISLAQGDFNRDGKLDLAVTAQNSDGYGNLISILLGNGKGVFWAARNFSTDSNNYIWPQGLTVGDWNGDGKLDVAVTDTAQEFGSYGALQIIFGNGDGTFQPPASYQLGINPVFVAAGDFNRDGKPDLVAANLGSNSIMVFLNAGNGTFEEAGEYTIGTTGNGPVRIAVADVNGDGKVDLVVADCCVGGSVDVLLGNGDGTFQTPVVYGLGTDPNDVVVADVNGDGKLDLVSCSESNNYISVFLGNGDGTFKNPRNYPMKLQPRLIVVADFNGDSILDMVLANQLEDGLQVFLGKGNGTFQPPVTYFSQAYVNDVIVTDLNTDGKPDLLAVGRGAADVMLGNGDGTFTQSIYYAATDFVESVAVGDFNGDGLVDFVSVSQITDELTVFLNETAGALVSDPVQ